MKIVKNNTERTILLALRGSRKSKSAGGTIQLNPGLSQVSAEDWDAWLEGDVIAQSILERGHLELIEPKKLEATKEAIKKDNKKKKEEAK